MVNVNSDCGGTKNDIRLCYSLPTYGVNKLQFLLDKRDTIVRILCFWLVGGKL